MTASNDYLFLSGAEMDPTAILTAHPGAQFVARARVSAHHHEIASPFAARLANDGSAEVWGIVIEHMNGSGEPRQAVTDDGRQIEAVLGGDQLASGAPEAVLAAARYWELPPAYVGRLRDAISAVDSEE